jgi:acetyl esterase/lipase
MRRGCHLFVIALAGATLTTVPAAALPRGEPQPTPGAATAEFDVVYREVGGQALTADVYLPLDDAVDHPVVLLVHGGAWRIGDKGSLGDEGRRLSEAGYVAVSVNYRLAPADPYPAAVEDVQAAVRWLRKPRQVRAYDLDPDRIGALGSSAGGHLVGMLAALGDGRLDRGARIVGAVSWSGPMDLTGAAAVIDAGTPVAGAELIGTFLGCTTGDCPAARAEEASPVTHVDKSDAPLLMTNSDGELTPLALVEPMVDALDDAGIENELIVFPGNRHARALSPDVWDDTLAFFHDHLVKAD